jgi:general secretion pathway protein E
MALTTLFARRKSGLADPLSAPADGFLNDTLAPPPMVMVASTPSSAFAVQEPCPPWAQSLLATPERSAKRYAIFGELPKFVRVLTQGDHPLYGLPMDALPHLLAIELEGRLALVLVNEESPIDLAVHNSLTGALATAGYTVQPMAIAPKLVLDEVRACSQSEDLKGSRYANPHMATVKTWLTYAVENRATDIHVEINGSAGQVRFRIDGELETMRTAGGGVYASRHVEDCLAALYNNEQQRKSGSDSLFDASKNLYCMVPYTSVPGHTLKLRYQSLRGNEGPKVILRLLHVNDEQPTLTFEQLGYAPSHIALWETAMQTPSGAILIAGITGSGKSTTQKSFIELNPAAASSAIYTIEDPVEYPIRHAHQYPIQRDLSDPAASARLYTETVAALMRADPDIVMLGEVRDEPSARALQQLVETGHMGLATVHAHLLSGIIPRLTNPEVGLNREVLTAPNMLTLLVYQALVPKLCPACSVPTAEALVTAPEVAATVAHFEALQLPTRQLRWKRMGGCKHCAHRGTIGLTVVAEMHMPDEDWLAAIRTHDDSRAVEIYRSYSDGNLASFNMVGKTVFEHALWKALQGHIDARQCTRFDSFSRYMARLARLRATRAASVTSATSDLTEKPL